MWLKELDFYDRSEIYVYIGIPVSRFNKIWRSLFGAGIVIEIMRGGKWN